MRIKSVVLITMIAIIVGGCDNDGSVQSDPKTKDFNLLNVDSIKLEPELEQALKMFNKNPYQKGLVSADSLFNDGYIEIPERFKNAWIAQLHLRELEI